MAKPKPVKRTSEIRAQVDRWPVKEDGEYVLTAIIVCTFEKKPEAADIAKAVRDAAEILSQ